MAASKAKWTKTVYEVPAEGPTNAVDGTFIATGDGHWLVTQDKAAGVVAGDSLSFEWEGAAWSPVMGPAIFDRGLILVNTPERSRLLRLDPDGFRDIDVELPAGEFVAMGDVTIALIVAESVLIYRVDGDTVTQEAVVPATKLSSVAAWGNHVAYNDGQLHLLARDTKGSWAEVEVTGGRATYRSPIFLSDDVLAVGVGDEDGVAGAGVDPDGGDALDSSGTVFTYARGSDGWTLAHQIKCDKPKAYMRFGAFMRGGGDLLAVFANDRAYVYQFGPEGQVAHLKTFRDKSIPTWHNAGVGHGKLVAGSDRHTIVHQLSAPSSAPKKRKSKKATSAARVLPPKTGDVQGLLPPLLELAQGAPDKESWASLLDQVAEAWALDAATVESEWLPALEKALAHWPRTLRTTRKVGKSSFPMVPGWYSLVRVASFSDHGDRETQDPSKLAGMGACLLPAHLEELHVKGCRLGATHLKGMLKGDYLSKLQVLDLAGNKIGNAGAKALGKASLPNLHSLVLKELTHVGADGLAALAANPSLGQLRELDLTFSFGDRWRKSDLPKGLGALTRSDILRLTHLNLNHCGIGDDALVELIEGPGAVHFSSLDLGLCDLTDRGASALTHGRLPALEELNLRDNSGIKELQLDDDLAAGLTRFDR